MERIHFFSVFRELEDGRLEPVNTINIKGVVIGPGVAFGPGVLFGGLDIFKIRGRDLALTRENGILILKGYYGPTINL